MKDIHIFEKSDFSDDIIVNSNNSISIKNDNIGGAMTSENTTLRNKSLVNSYANIRYKFTQYCVTWQGEGIYTGKRMLLIRFPKCNLKCPFCDTWDMIEGSSKHEKTYSLDKIIHDAHEADDYVMITGGEPTLYINELIDLCSALILETNGKCTINIETNGFKIVELIDQLIIRFGYETFFNCITISLSPKYYKDDLWVTNKENFVALQLFHNVTFKFIIDNDNKDDMIKEIQFLIDDLGINRQNVYVMPIGTNPEEMSRNFSSVIEVSTNTKCNISGRLHLYFGIE